MLWDLSAFYEFIRRGALVERARDSGFRAETLRVALSAYGMFRLYTKDSVSVGIGHALVGVVAGCPLATTLVAVYTVAVYDACLPKMPGIHLSVMIDDLSVQTSGKVEADIVDRLAGAGEVLYEAIEDELGCSISFPKAAVVASTQRLGKRLLSRFGIAWGQNLGTTVQNLGSDFSAGRKRGAFSKSSVRRARVKKARARMPRLKRLKKGAGSRTATLFSTGLLSSAAFASEIFGVSNKELEQLRATAAATTTPAAQGRSRSLLFALRGDPTHKAATAPIHRYAAEVWDALLDLGNLTQHQNPDRMTVKELVASWKAAKEESANSWNKVRGPFGAYFLSLARVGWSAPAPFKVITDQGVEIDFAWSSPKRVQGELRAAVQRIHERKAVKHLQGEGGNSDRCDPHNVRKILRSGRFTEIEKGCLAAVACKACWIQQDLMQAGYAVNGFCQLCKREPDTRHHRWYQCPAARQIREQTLGSLGEVGKRIAREAREIGEGSPLFDNALAASWAHLVPGPAEEGGIEIFARNPAGILVPAADVSLHGKVFLDGSMKPGPVPELNRAGWAAVSFDDDSCLPAAVVRGPVWNTLGQTAATAEFVAVAVLAQFADARAEPYIDCEAALAATNASPAWALAPSKQHAGIIKKARLEAGFRNFCLGRKVKAHQDLSKLGGEELAMAVRNDLADHHAKEAVACHPQAEQQTRKEIEDEAALSQGIAVLIAKLAPLWPKAVKGKRRQLVTETPSLEQAEPPAAGRRDNTGDGNTVLHQMVPQGAFWRCAWCSKLGLTEASAARLGRCQCAGRCANPAAKAAGQQQLGHDICEFGSETGLKLHVCLRCGGAAAHRPFKLSRQCAPPTPYAARALAKLLGEGKHPEHPGETFRVARRPPNSIRTSELAAA